SVTVRIGTGSRSPKSAAPRASELGTLMGKTRCAGESGAATWPNPSRGSSTVQQRPMALASSFPLDVFPSPLRRSLEIDRRAADADADAPRRNRGAEHQVHRRFDEVAC